jgi:hypothetical protein
VLRRTATSESAKSQNPRDLETICLKSLEKEPNNRYQSARALADELGRFERNEPILARPISSPERIWRWSRRKPALAAVAFLLLLVSATGLAGILWQSHRADQNARMLAGMPRKRAKALPKPGKRNSSLERASMPRT